MVQVLRPAKLVSADGAAEMNMVLQHIHPFARTVFQLGNLSIMYVTMTGACVHFFVFEILKRGSFYRRKSRLIKP